LITDNQSLVCFYLVVGMTTKPLSKKKSGSSRPSVDAGDKDLLMIELKNRVAALENELRIKQENSTSPDSAERKRAKEALDFERSQLLSIFDSIDDVVYVTDLYTYEVLYANKAMKERFGGDLVGGICYREFQKKDTPCDFCTNSIIMKDRDKPYRWEYYNPTVGRYFMITDRIIKWPDGRDVRFEIAKDITERRQAEEALRESEEKFKTIFDRAGMGIAIAGPGGYIRDCNRAYQELLGYSKADLREKRFIEFTHPEDVDRNQELQRQLTDGLIDKYQIEKRYIRKDGRSIWVLLTASAIRDRDGSLRYNLAVAEDITERKRAEMALRESEAKYRDLVKNANSIIIRWDLNGNLTFFNEFAEEFFGYPASEVLGKSVMDTIVPASESTGRDLAAMIRDIEHHPERYKTNLNENIRRNGERVWISWTNKAIRDSQGNVAEILSVGNDITERKQAEDALRESEKKFRVLAETSPAAIFLYQGDKYLYVNPMAETLTGYSRDELLTEDAWGWIHADFLDLVRERAMRRQRGELLPTRYEVKYCSRDGREGWVDFTAGLVEYRGRPAGLAMAFDVSERKRTEEALNASKQFLKNIFDSIQDGISILDKDLNIIQVNHVMEEWYTYMKPLAGKKCYFAYYEQQSPCRVCPSQRAIKLKTAQSDIVPFHGEDGRLKGWLELFAFPLKDDQGNVTGVIEHVRNITERKQAEEALEEAKAQAELYLDLMGHDINNMHQIALGYLEIARETSPDAGQGKYLDKPIEVLQRSARLIRNVRKLQKLHDGVFQNELVDVAKVLSDVQREYGAVPDKAVTLNLNGYDHCRVRANELLHDVFVNLVSNAIKHTKDRANIVVDLDVVLNDGRRFCRVLVEDDGPGIPDAFKGKIFNRLMKGTDKAKGMGLGLYLVKSLVESYGGRVWVEDRVLCDHTKGARFVVMLPEVEK
jgi:PAS domain S-box-containing protein